MANKDKIVVCMFDRRENSTQPSEEKIIQDDPDLAKAIKKYISSYEEYFEEDDEKAVFKDNYAMYGDCFFVAMYERFLKTVEVV